MKELRKIREGQNGNEVAQLIYNNDSDLLDEITACKETIETNKAYVAQINASGCKVDISVLPSTGYSMTDVISQSGVTQEFNKVKMELGNMCSMLDLDIPENIDPPVIVVNATHSVQASRDAEGHLLSQMYYDIRDLQRMVAEIDTLKTQIEDLKRRVNVLESKLNEA